MELRGSVIVRVLVNSTFLSLILICGSVCIADAATLSIAKEEALIRAMERNLGIRIQQSRVEIANEGIRSEKGAFDTGISAGFERSSAGDQNADSLSVSADGLLATGGTYEIGVSSSEGFPGESHFNSFAGVTFRQPLLRNFGLSNNLTGLNIARHRYDLSEWEYKQLLLDTLAATIFAFNDLYQAQQNLISFERSRDLAERLVNDSKKRVELGVIAPLDLVSAEAQLATRRERALQVSSSVRRAQNRLKQLIFDNADEALAVDLEVIPYREARIDQRFEDVLPALLENSPERRMGEIALEIARLRYQQDRNQALPSLDFIAQYGFSGSGSTYHGLLFCISF